jgi:VanZ family protein
VLDQPMFTAGPRSAFRQFLFYWLPVLFYISMIFYFSSLSNPPAPMHFDNADKIEHLCEYGLFSLLLGRAIRRTVAPHSALASVMITASLVMMVGAADEYYQSFVPGRDSDVWDWATDSSAGILAQLLLWRTWAVGAARRKAS